MRVPTGDRRKPVTYFQTLVFKTDPCPRECKFKTIISFSNYKVIYQIILLELMSMNSCTVLYTGNILKSLRFKAFLPPLAFALRTVALYTTEMRNRQEARPRAALWRLQDKHRFMHTMKASFRVFWLVSQYFLFFSFFLFLQSSVVCIQGCFFSTHQKSQEEMNWKKKIYFVLRTADCKHLLPDWNNFHCEPVFVLPPYLAHLVLVWCVFLAPANVPWKIKLNNALVCKSL